MMVAHQWRGQLSPRRKRRESKGGCGGRGGGGGKRKRRRLKLQGKQDASMVVFRLLALLPARPPLPSPSISLSLSLPLGLWSYSSQAHPPHTHPLTQALDDGSGLSACLPAWRRCQRIPLAMGALARTNHTPDHRPIHISARKGQRLTRLFRTEYLSSILYFFSPILPSIM